MTVRTGRRAAKQLGPEANPAQMPLSDLASFRARSDSAIPIAGR